MNAEKLLASAVARCNPPTGHGLALALGVTDNAVSNWRTGRAYPDEVSCARLAQLLELPLGQVLGIVGEARSHSSAAKAVWRALARSASAAVLVAAATLLAPTPANAAQSPFWGYSRPLYIMSGTK